MVRRKLVPASMELVRETEGVRAERQYGGSVHKEMGSQFRVVDFQAPESGRSPAAGLR